MLNIEALQFIVTGCWVSFLVGLIWSFIVDFKRSSHN